MSADEIIMAAVAVALVTWPVYAWLMERRRKRTIDDCGRVYGMQRWPHESNRDFARRIRARQSPWGPR